MGIGLTGEHRALADSVRGLAERGAGQAALAAQGLLGLHLPERCGGQGYGLLELCVALEALGERRVAGPYLPTVLTSAGLAWAGAADGVLAALAGGSMTAAVALPSGSPGASPSGSPLSGSPGSPLGGPFLALGAAEADVFLLPSADGAWTLLERDAVTAVTAGGIDLDRPLCSVTPHSPRTGRVLPDAPVRQLAAVLLGADACGVAAWAVATAAGHAKAREQFGRPIGQFQGVKHRVAAALVALEQARAAVWDAARALDTARHHPQGLTPEARLAVAVAGVLGTAAGVRCAADAIQVLGGIGYTFEHDAHRYYRRALSDRRWSGDPGGWAEEAAALAVAGVRRTMEPDLPEEAAPLRDAIRAEAESLRAEEPAARRARFARDGWIMPYLPKPWGRGASALEQVLIHQEFRDLRRPNLGIAAWAVPSIVTYGTPEQQERFLPRTFAGEIVWCQLFSEPGAGSDLAGLATKATRVEGGWSLSGQKIWTSLAQYAHWGICLARTSPDRPKHEGITYFLVDMSSPGVTVRPLKEINGDEIFNEVFLDDVFVPDDLVVGEVDQGWRVARDTLSHERVALGDSWGPGARHTDLAALVAGLPPLGQARREQAGRLWAEGQAISALGLRVTLSRLAGGEAGAAASVRKLLGMRHAQAIAEFCWSLVPDDPHWGRMILATRAFTIGGGTTEVQLNIIGERALGLPRDP
ncbi:acyl-CoA dehydrogenase family protein [Actinomadura sp. ATCC 31491]|uniref:Acyl-CoA dehydrogenase family protein n=1 Tax=Actinomadura luzonensis TaxID=2805427 RepID=A0ABT0FZZ3_9ACTN|nr:acyl-CoA dehydrogenase [Actinomadura luzonensis]MCK2217468.1 acyl-CoA dehydrogenase family protein [Actinomadura luzonensis]